MSFSETSKNEAVQLIEAKINGEQNCYSSIVNEAVRMIKEERNKVQLYEHVLNLIEEGYRGSGNDLDEILDKYFYGGTSPVRDKV